MMSNRGKPDDQGLVEEIKGSWTQVSEILRTKSVNEGQIIFGFILYINYFVWNTAVREM